MKFEAIIQSALNSRLEDQAAFTEDMARIASLVEGTDLKKNLTFEINLTKIVASYKSCRSSIGGLLDRIQSSTSSLLDLRNIQADNFKPK